MPPFRPAVVQPWWRRHAPPPDPRSRGRMVLHLLLMAGLLAAMLAV